MITATLYANHGSDNMVVDMARASFAKPHTAYTDRQNARLIRYLARGMSESEYAQILQEAADTTDLDVLKDCFQRMKAQTHWTPFAHPQITLLTTVPIFVARQDFKHIIGFVRSEVSRRYVDDTPALYSPDEWRGRPEGSVKQGSSDDIVITTMDSWAGIDGDNSVKRYCEILNANALSAYQNLLDAGVAPEQARMVLPQSMMTSYYVTGSLAAFARAYKQRSDSHAQKEIQDLAAQWDAVIRPLFPVSWSALIDNKDEK